MLPALVRQAPSPSRIYAVIEYVVPVVNLEFGDRTKYCATPDVRVILGLGLLVPTLALVTLPDFTKKAESVSLDSVRIRWAGSGTSRMTGTGLPICAQGSPDATICTC